MGLENRDIVCISSSSWDAMWVNSQHLMSRLARRNRVLYVNNTGLRMPGASAADVKKIVDRLKNSAGGVQKKQDTLWVLAPIIIPYHKSPGFRRVNAWWLSRVLRKRMRSLGMRAPILWIFLPTGVDLIGRLGESGVVYHCVDEYSQNPGVPTQQIREMEQRLCRGADAVLTTSTALYEEKKPLNANTLYFGNVANVAHFSRVLDEPDDPPADVRGLRRPVVGYVGNIASYKVDLPLLEAVARARPEWSFVLVGPIGWGDPTTNVRPLQALGNVTFVDRKEYDELPAYIRAFDVCLIPFAKSPVTDNSFPMKFFEYLAVGKPIVARRLTSLESVCSDPEICRLADTPDEFLAAIEAGLAETDDGRVVAKRLAVARENDWEQRVEEIGDAVGARIGGGVR